MLLLLVLAQSVQANDIPLLPELVVTAEPEPTATLAQTRLLRRDIQDAAITDLRSLIPLIPNVRFADYGRATYQFLSMRGQVNSDYQPDVSTLVLVDGVPYSDYFSLNTGLYAIEQIEVLRGPQGTRFGPNAQAGVINISSIKPGNQTEKRVTLGVESHAGRSLAWRLAPLADTPLAWDFSGVHRQRDGVIPNAYTGNNLDKQRSTALRLAALLTPATSRWEFFATVASERTKDQGGLGIVPIDATAYAAYAGVRLNRGETWLDFPGDANSNSHTASLQARFQDEDWRFSSQTSYRHFDRIYRTDVDFKTVALPGEVAIAGGTYQIKEIGQEFRVESTRGPSEPSWLTGIYLARQQRYNQLTVYPDAQSPGYPSGGAHLNSYTTAWFGETRLPWWQNRAAFTLGGRLESTRRALSSVALNNPFAQLPGFYAAPGFAPVQAASAHHSFTHRLGAEYLPTAALTLYASHATGWRTGGLNPLPFPNLLTGEYDNLSYRPEKSRTGEVGILYRHNNYNVKTAVFHTVIDDYQDLFTPTLLALYVGNARRARINGPEIQYYNKCTPSR